MSQENVEIARDWLSRWNAGERSFQDEEIHPDVVIVSRGVLDRTVRGHAGLRRYLREWSIGATRETSLWRWAISVSTAGGAASHSINPLGSSMRSEGANCFASRPSLTSPPKPSKPPGCRSRRVRLRGDTRPGGD
jgi:hypothetical protein